MRKALPYVLLVLGALLVTVGVLAQTYAPGKIEKTPLDTDTRTALSGTGQLRNDDFELEETPLLAFSRNAVDADLSDDDTVVFASSLCLVVDVDDPDGCVTDEDPQGRLVSATTDTFATDRNTGLSISDPDELPEGVEPHEGLINKWPFGTEKKDYPVWDGIVGGAVDATYEGTDEIDGLDVYVFELNAEADGVVVAGEDIVGSYRSDNTYYVDPRTGQIVRQEIDQVRSSESGETLLEMNLAFTDEQVETNVDKINDDKAKLDLMEKTIPLVGYVVGIPLLLLGLFLVVRGNRRNAPASGGSGQRAKQPADA
ncbi:DUF3068 domain-containing protein [Nocardioides ferulae]|uniref:DUF3068 domain-containing protein n=1 Tax=Nocardioides ferulae TaxID=2340821 RepID=UPI0013DDFA77|nr:DUF3068 domain-containing protein [Nocardioides ferulae]